MIGGYLEKILKPLEMGPGIPQQILPYQMSDVEGRQKKVQDLEMKALGLKKIQQMIQVQDQEMVLVMTFHQKILETLPKKKLTYPYFLKDASQKKLNHVETQLMDVVQMGSLQLRVLSMKVVWNTKHVRIPDMAAVEMGIQQLREPTSKAVQLMFVKLHYLAVVMMEKLLLLELERKANVKKIRNAKLGSLAAAQMAVLSLKDLRSRDVLNAQRKFSCVTNVRRLNLVAVPMKMGKYMKIAHSLNMVVVPTALPGQ